MRHGWHDLCRGPPNIAMLSGPHGHRIEEFLSFSNHKSMQAIDPQGRDKFSPKGPD